MDEWHRKLAVDLGVDPSNATGDDAWLRLGEARVRAQPAAVSRLSAPPPNFEDEPTKG